MRDSYDFEISDDIKDTLSLAPSHFEGGGSVRSNLSRLRTGHSTTRHSLARPWTSMAGSGGDDAASIASTSMSALSIRNRKAVNSASSQTPAEVAKDLEESIDELISQTVTLRKGGKLEEALECAKEGTRKEQLLRKHHKINSLPRSSEEELMHSTWFNLATAYEANDMLDDALKTYTYLAKQRGNPFAGRLRINMGNIYYTREQYPTAIIMYKMALDLLTKEDGYISNKVRRNMGNAHFRMGKMRDAVKAYEQAMETGPDFHTGFNLLVCHLALSDVDSVKKDFKRLSSIMPSGRDDPPSEEEILMGELDESQDDQSSSEEANVFLLKAARLIAPKLDSDNWAAGYDWVCETLEEHHQDIAVQLKAEKATKSLKHKDIGPAVKMLKNLHKKRDGGIASAIATNLSLVSFLEGNIEQASELADAAIVGDRYNAKALVNKGNCLFINGDIDSAKDLYLEAIGIQADNVQAIFNLGLANAQLGLAEEAISAFEKAHRITPNNPQILYQIADIYELQGRTQDAMKWFNVLSARIPNDSTNLARTGSCYAESGDDSSQSLHYLLESFRQNPTDLDVISMIGKWFVEKEMYQRSIVFFKQAALVQPKEIKWGFMVASAHKRCGNHDLALEEYRKLHGFFPQSEECLRHLIAACHDADEDDFQYQDKLTKLVNRC